MSSPLAAGSIVGGRYRVEAPIGEGGHGMVYRATDTSVGRAVALKLLHRGLPGAANLEARFEQEARLARRLQHPNTVRLLDFGHADDGAMFIAYELLDGLPMDHALQAGPMPPERVARIGSQILKSLMEAHQHGVVHRDMKPSNVFLCNYSGERDFVKVLDFGIAKSAEVGTQLTQTGFVVGTPSYMAPEQVRGDVVRPATDLYAVGLLLAEALTGQVIVLGNTDAVTAATQLSHDPVPLPPAVLQSPLGHVIHRATQKPLERRYTSAQQMLDDIAATSLAGSPPASAPDRVSFGEAPTGMLPAGQGVSAFAPTAHGPAMHSPAMHGPAMHSPAMHGPAMHSPAMHSPAMHSPAMHSPAMHSPAMHSPAIHSPAMDSPAMHSPPPHAGPSLAAPQPLTRPKSGGGGLLVGIIAVAALAAIVIAGGVIWAVGARAADVDTEEASVSDDDGESARRGKKKKTKNEKKEASPPSETDTDAGDLASLTLDTVKIRLAASGFEVVNISKLTNDPSVTVLTTRRSSSTSTSPIVDTASVMFTIVAGSAKRLVRTMGNRSTAVVARADDNALAILGLDESKRETLLQELVGLKKPAPRPEPAPAPAPEPQVPAAPSPSPTPRPVPTPRPQPAPQPPPPSPRPRSTQSCNCPPNDLMCAMRCSSSK